jgi:serpin B
MKLKRTILAGLLISSLMLTGCQYFENQGQTIPKPDDSILDAFQVAIVEQGNDFGFQTYKLLANSQENMMISPVSIGMALDMTYNGAAGATREAMAVALKLEGIDIKTLNQNNQALLYLLSTADSKVTVDIANSLWLRDGFELNQDFSDRVETHYLATLQTLDFSDPKSPAAINKWVEENTRGMIKEIITPPIDPAAVMFLINAMSFKGEWTSPFDKELTSEQDFKTGAGQTVKVPMMFQSGAFDYLKAANFQAVRMPYGEEDRMAMYLFLPNEDANLAQFQEQLNQANWKSWLTLFENGEGSVMLPRFTMEYEQSLNSVLTDLGMGIAFEAGKADFSDMAADGASGQELYISEVKHKTYIQVDEVGTEAAAATSVEIGLTSMPVYDFELKFDRPFFFAIQDKETGAILFMGSVGDPSK